LARPVLLFDNMSTTSLLPTELLTVAEVAEFLKISKVGVRRLQYGRLIPFHKIGGSVRFSKDDVAAYLAKQRVEAVDQ
jgi:excisionase family DNA binding protein